MNVICNQTSEKVKWHVFRRPWIWGPFWTRRIQGPIVGKYKIKQKRMLSKRSLALFGNPDRLLKIQNIIDHKKTCFVIFTRFRFWDKILGYIVVYNNIGWIFFGKWFFLLDMLIIHKKMLLVESNRQINRARRPVLLLPLSPRVRWNSLQYPGSSK